MQYERAAVADRLWSSRERQKPKRKEKKKHRETSLFAFVAVVERWHSERNGISHSHERFFSFVLSLVYPLVFFVRLQPTWILVRA